MGKAAPPPLTYNPPARATEFANAADTESALGIDNNLIFHAQDS